MKRYKQILLLSAISLLAPSGVFSRTDSTASNILPLTESSKPDVEVTIEKKGDEQILAAATLDKQVISPSTASPIHALEQHQEYKAGSEVLPSATDSRKKFSDQDIARIRQLFLQAEDAVRKGRDKRYFQLSGQLEDYPLYPYLQYQWLKKHPGSEKKIKDFLEHYSQTRYAPILKRRWLKRLAKHKQWNTFLDYYTKTSSKSLTCYYNLARYHTGDRGEALKAAQKLWAVGYSQPRQCDPLFTLLKKSKYFTQDLLWKRFEAALQNHKVSLAIYVKNQMSKSSRNEADLWIKLYRHPARYIPSLLAGPVTSRSGLMFAHAIERLATRDINSAIKIWDDNKQRFELDQKRIAKLEKRLAFSLVYSRESGAYERFSQLPVADDTSREWRIRAALLEKNWTGVIDAIASLNSVEQSEEKWRYWLARAYLETGQVEKSEQLFNELSQERSFYGYLAADKVNSMYQLSDSPIHVSQEDINRLKEREPFRVAFEFIVLDRINEAKLQWWHAIRQLTKDEIVVAAKLAKQWQWDEIAIFTIAKVKLWDDVKMRFPLTYSDKVYENAQRHQLNPSIIFGLIRRESAFNEKAHSPAGAKGLMQLMPQTGRQIAKHFNERWRGSKSLYDPVKNLKYGAYYYQKLLKEFNGNYAIALAAYNAGPQRVKKWLPQDSALPADIWIETIPYRETREYVTAVLTYTLIYQQRTDKAELTMADLTQEILPADNK